MAFTVNVNGKAFEAEVDGDTPVLWVLRDALGLTGTKFGCGIAMCGACTVHVGGQARRSCVSPISMVGSAQIRTIEGLDDTAVGKALQGAWRELDVVQCGYCQPGQLMSAAALLAAKPAPSDEDIDSVMSGNLCRCGTYGRIRAGVKRAASIIASARVSSAKRAPK
jgi:isoquinoline 1-oxidoreductase alpha subunit